MRSRVLTPLGLVACIAGLIGCDHATKLAAESSLRDRGPLALVPGVLDLQYTENRDVAFDAFSRLALHPPAAFLVAFALAATCVTLLFWTRRSRGGAAEHAAFSLIIAGALGNLIDRALRGHVVDFIHLRFWPVFNVADVLVCAGVALLLWNRRRPRAPAGPLTS